MKEISASEELGKHIISCLQINGQEGSSSQHACRQVHAALARVKRSLESGCTTAEMVEALETVLPELQDKAGRVFVQA